jgi:RNA polymerase sigma-70 factor, ECF subfamily
LSAPSQVVKFEQWILPHADAAYNLARWLLHNDHDAEDVAQEALLRAFKFFEGFHGTNGRVWLLKIVRNTCYSWLTRNHPREVVPLEEEKVILEDRDLNPEEKLIQNADGKLLREILATLPVAFREVAIMADVEGLTYKEISEVAGISMGTVMSRLARARKRMRQSLVKRMEKEF